MSTEALRVDGQRLWQSLLEMAKIGATPAGGCNRQALTDEDKEGRDLFVQWCRDASLEVRCDQMGNLFARRAGRRGDLPPLLAGSHLDTQPTGGRFDGVAGVLAALEAVRTLDDAGVTTEGPIEIVSWTNEEGARFSPAMIGSGVWAGVFQRSWAYSRTDSQGRELGDELGRIGYLGEERARHQTLRAAFELHIEQGPLLEQEGLQIGIVVGVQGMSWYDVLIEGEPAHAGTTPMAARRDPLRSLPKMLERLYALALGCEPEARITFGEIEAQPGARNTVPGLLRLSVDLRHPDADTLAELDAELCRIVTEEGAAFDTPASVRREWSSPPVVFDPACVAAVRGAAERLGYAAREMTSGAGHDAVYVSRVAPTSMIFIPCAGGISHNELESATPEDLEAGANVLLHALLDRDGASRGRC